MELQGRAGEFLQKIQTNITQNGNGTAKEDQIPFPILAILHILLALATLVVFFLQDEMHVAELEGGADEHLHQEDVSEDDAYLDDQDEFFDDDDW
ncbi:unnamed protein product [Caenorhabditis auriculariae]|uniref:Uncharacterized protein n=1 Tax=Caenorhabditis auriculariae TaxID=2777116 RepID=A0A8S1H5U7_9PELO|nr:unnamed protein product [Caenorhabditis auriculariae]